MASTILTGIKPTGTPHIGNLFGAIKPAIALASQYQARYFIADYHALNTVRNPAELRSMTWEVAAAWLACGLDPSQVVFYRQSDVPQTFELSTILMAFTAKGLMNRAHAYKAKVAENLAAGEDTDAGVNMGLYTYPILMAADILLFDTELVPVGKDQVQHVEMAVDIAQAINHNYGASLLTIPKAVTSEETQTIVGLDGRKMSKSYQNTLPLFCEDSAFKKLIMKIVTDSTPVEAPKDPDSSHIFSLYRLFTTPAQQDDFARRMQAGGMGWGHAKQELYEVAEAVLKPIRDRYRAFMADTAELDRILVEGAVKAQAIAAATISRLRTAIGVKG